MKRKQSDCKANGSHHSKSTGSDVWLPEKIEPDPKLLCWMEKSSKLRQVAHNKLVQRLESELKEKAGDIQETDLLRLTLEHLGVWQLPPALPCPLPENPKAAKIQALGENLQRCIGHMERFASQGDAAAIKHYANLVLKCVENLNTLALKHREKVLPLSRQCLSWPVRVSKRKVFGDNADELILKLQIGADTIANDPTARFNPKSRFGKIAFQLIERIENARTNPVYLTLVLPHPQSWEAAAQKLPPFNIRATPDEKKSWQAVVKKILKGDFSDPVQADIYRRLITAKSHQNRWKAVFENKVIGEFDSLWGLHRKAKG